MDTDDKDICGFREWFCALAKVATLDDRSVVQPSQNI